MVRLAGQIAITPAISPALAAAEIARKPPRLDPRTATRRGSITSILGKQMSHPDHVIDRVAGHRAVRGAMAGEIEGEPAHSRGRGEAGEVGVVLLA